MEKKYTTEDLEYIAFVARNYCNLLGTGVEEYVVLTALEKFEYRVSEIECASNYELYKSTSTLQEKLKKYNFDSYKFWFLLLFLKDYTESCFGKSWVFDEISVGKNVKDMIDMLDNYNKEGCEITISTKNKSAHISAIWIINELKELLFNLQQNQKDEINNTYPCIGTTEDKVQWHKIKFFMDMFFYFLDNYHIDESQKKSNRKDWLLFAQSLYLVGYLNEEKYLKGYTVTKQTYVKLYGENKTIDVKSPLKGLGKYFTDSTKHLTDTSNRWKSLYCYKPF